VAIGFLVEIMKSLVVYYSRTGNTKTVGEAIAKEWGADCEEIIDLKKRTGLRPIRWLIAGKDAWRRKLTKIRTQKKPENYDIIIVGTPIWAGKMTPAVRTYLTTNKLDGKKVGFFCTAARGTEKAFEEMEKLVPRASVVGTLGIRAGEVKSSSYGAKVKSFVESLKLVK
jgi:flavodoxin